MKHRKLSVILLLIAVSYTAMAQDDDMYFGSSSKSTKQKTQDAKTTSASARMQDANDPWVSNNGDDGFIYSDNQSSSSRPLRDVDEYNRHPKATQPVQTHYEAYMKGDSLIIFSTDTVSGAQRLTKKEKNIYDIGYGDGYQDATDDYSLRLARFRNHRYYDDYYWDRVVYIYAPWYYDPWYYDSWYYNRFWYDPWYYGPGWGYVGWGYVGWGGFYWGGGCWGGGRVYAGGVRNYNSVGTRGLYSSRGLNSSRGGSDGTMGGRGMGSSRGNSYSNNMGNTTRDNRGLASRDNMGNRAYSYRGSESARGMSTNRTTNSKVGTYSGAGRSSMSAASRNGSVSSGSVGGSFRGGSAGFSNGNMGGGFHGGGGFSGGGMGGGGRR